MKANKLYLYMFAVTALMMTASPSANACSCAEPPPIADDFAGTSKVFVGEIIRKVGVDNSNNGDDQPDLFFYTVRVLKAYKGVETGGLYQIRSENQTSCGIELDDHQKLVFWMNPQEDYFAWQVQPCNRTRGFDPNSEDIRWLNENAGARVTRL